MADTKNEIFMLPEALVLVESLLERDVYKDKDTGAEGKPKYKVVLAFDPAQVIGDGTIEDKMADAVAAAHTAMASAATFGPESSAAGTPKLDRVDLAFVPTSWKRPCILVVSVSTAEVTSLPMSSAPSLTPPFRLAPAKTPPSAKSVPSLSVSLVTPLRRSAPALAPTELRPAASTEAARSVSNAAVFATTNISASPTMATSYSRLSSDKFSL